MEVIERTLVAIAGFPGEPVGQGEARGRLGPDVVVCGGLVVLVRL
jgi:hypothetical protein